MEIENTNIDSFSEYGGWFNKNHDSWAFKIWGKQRVISSISNRLLVYKFDGLCVYINKMFALYLLLQFLSKCYKVWFFINLGGISCQWTKKNPEKSRIQEEIRNFLSKTFYNITHSRFCRQMAPSPTWRLVSWLIFIT